MIEILYPWIILGLLMIILILMIKAYVNPMMHYKKMDRSSVIEKPLKIPAGDITINAKLILPKYALDENKKPLKKLPLIFLNHGWSMNIDMPILLSFATTLAIGGPHAVLLYECRGHGKTPGKKKLDERVFDDVPKVLDFGFKLEEIDPNRVGFIGMSFGGEVALTRAYADERIKAIVSIVSPHNAKANFTRKPESFKARVNISGLKMAGVKGNKISDETNESISPEYILKKDKKDLNSRVFLINARHDNLISIKEFEKNRAILGIPDDQVLILEKGGHAMFHQELVVMSSALRFFKAKLDS